MTELIRIFATPENVGDFLDLNSVVIVSADGVGNVTNLLGQSTWADEPIPSCAVLLDSDDAADAEVLRITRPEKPSTKLLPKESIGQLANLIAPYGSNQVVVTTEDVVPAEMYKRAIRKYVERWLPTLYAAHASKLEQSLADAAFGGNGLAESTKGLFAEIQPELNGDFDKMGIFQLVIDELASCPIVRTSSDAQLLTDNVKSICRFLNHTLDDAALALPNTQRPVQSSD